MNGPIGPFEILVILFVTLGPLKILGPWVQRTRDLDEPALRKVAIWAFVIATIAIIAGSALGRILAANWQVSIGSLGGGGGGRLFPVGVQQIHPGGGPA